jgi:hypothetical protein
VSIEKTFRLWFKFKQNRLISHVSKLNAGSGRR